MTESARAEVDLMTRREVADLFLVDPTTVTRWARQGRLSCIRTLGGHRRYAREEVERLLAARSTTREARDA